MAEMSGRFLADGRELTVDELFEFRQRGRRNRVERRFTYAGKSFLWLGHALGLPTSFDLAGMVRQIDLEGSATFYHDPQLIEKSDGGTRVIISPMPELKFVQGRINRLLKRNFKRPENVFGYRGGTCYEVAERHLNWPSTLKFDIKDAFFKVSWTDVRTAIRGSRYRPGSGFSGSIAYWISRLCTYHPVPSDLEVLAGYAHSFLPQGAPTSPVCFDIACAPLDAKLTRIAERVGGIVNRYADNYYFSMPTSRISPKLERMIVCDARKHGGFHVHKVRRVDQGELCRILGYNLHNGRITNTRDFNRNLRGALYVLRTKLDRGLEWQEAYARVRGYMGVAVNLSDQLRQTYEYCESRIASL
ncbi:MAG: reverse transcriptase domain-containing protein [bacterium]|nr:reverse transcriptase domain-containing protein [bacterium]